MDSQLPEGRKAEKSLPYKFFANPYVQGVGVLIALAVAFSGKLDHNGTIVCIVLGGIIGLFGIWSHISRRVLRVVAMAAYLVAIVVFALYLTAKPREVAADTAEGSQPRQVKLEAKNSPQGAATSQQSAPASQSPSNTDSHAAKKQKPKKLGSKTGAETKTAAEQIEKAASKDCQSTGIKMDGNVARNYFENMDVTNYDCGVAMTNGPHDNTFKGLKANAKESKTQLLTPQPQPSMSQECAPGAQCAQSTNQSGGITAAEINIGAVDRHLGKASAEVLTSIAKDLPTNRLVVDISTTENAEAETLADEIGVPFLEQGIIHSRPPAGRSTVTPKGVVVLVHSKDDSAYPLARKIADALSLTVSAVGIAVNADRVPVGRVKIIVGDKTDGQPDVGTDPGTIVVR